MNEYIKWLLIGFILGVGFYGGERTFNYVYTHYIQTMYVPYEDYENVKDLSNIAIEQQRLVYEGREFKIVGFIDNNSGEDYYDVVIESLIYDNEGLIDVCRVNYTKLSIGQQSFEEHCGFAAEQDNDRFIRSTIVKQAFRDKRT